MTAPAFSFGDLRRLTPALPGHLRAAAFLALPETLQAAAWQTLAVEVEQRSLAMWAAYLSGEPR